MRAPSLFVALCSLVLCTVAAPRPLPVANATLGKRITHVGRGTFFDPEGFVGACGEVDQDTDHIVAISTQRYGSGGNCNQWIHITANGNTAFGLTRDHCATCGIDDLDMSESLYQLLANLGTNEITVTWNFEPFGFQP